MAKAIKSTLKIVRGIEAELPILRVGELGYATDSNTLFVGDPDEGNVKINLNLDRKIILARDFGILGEGKDYSEEITKLLAYLEVNPTDEVVFEPNSIIYTNVSLRVSNTALKGMGTTILPVANSDLYANQKALIILNDNSSADRFILDGNRENNYYYKGEEKRYSGASAVTANVEPKGVSGIWVIGDNCYVTRNTFKDISWSCIDVNGKNKESGRNKNVQVYWNTFYNSAEDHIAMHSCDNVRVYQNYSYDASNHAIHAYSLCSNIQIFNNYIKINKDNVIEWNDGYINASQRTALIIDHPAYPQSQVENTTVKNNIIEGDFVNGVEITGYTENFQIYENKFIGNAGNIGIRFKTVSFGTSFIKRNRFTNVSKAFSINTLSMLGLPTYGVPTVGSVLVEDNYYYDLTTAYEMFAKADIPGIDSFTFTCRNNHYHNVAKSTNIHQMLTNFHLEMYDDLDWETATFNGNTLYERENSIRTKEGPNVNILPYNFDLTDLDGNILGISTRIKYNTGVDTIVTKPEDGLLLITAAGDEMKSFTNVIMRYNLNPLANYDEVTMKTRFTSETDVHFYLLIQALDKNGQKKGQVTVIDTEVIAGEEYSFNNIFNLSTYSFNDPECILNIILQFGIEESYNPFTNFKLMELSMVGGLMYNIPVEYNCYTIQEIYKYIEPLKLYNSDIPTSGTYQLGTTIVNTNPKSGGYIGWVCVEEGTPGVWEGYELNEKAPLIHSHNMSDVSDLQDALNSKVNAVSGKSLVSDTEIARLANVDNYDDTEIRGLIPTKTSQLTNDSNYLTTIPSEYITETELNNKIDETKTEIDNNINEINSQLDDITKEIKRNKNIKDYRFLCATFRNGDNYQKLIVQGSDDGEKFYEIAPEGCYIPKLSSSLRDPSIVKVGEYFYITYTTVAWDKGNTIGFVKTKDFINFEGEKLFNIGSFTRIWSPCWFKDGTNLWIIINATNDETVGPEPTGWNVYLIPFDYSNDTIENTNMKKLEGIADNTIDCHLYKFIDKYVAVVKNETTKYIEVYKSSNIYDGYTLIRGGDWAKWGKDFEGAYLMQLENGKLRMYLDNFSHSLGRNFLLYSDSVDNGLTWTPLKDVKSPHWDVRHATFFDNNQLEYGTNNNVFESTNNIKGNQCVIVKSAVEQTIPNIERTTVQFEQAVYDYFNLNNNGIITCKENGIYHISTQIVFDGTNTEDNTRRMIFILKNGESKSSVSILNGGSTLPHAMICSATVDLGVGDSIAIIVVQESGAPLNITTGPDCPVLSMFKVGE